MKTNYWLETATSRRHVLQAASAAAGGIASLSLIGCGGGKDGESASTAAKAPAIDSTKGKAGGTLKVYAQGYPGNFDPIVTQNAWYITGFAHSGLLQHTWGVASVDSFDFYSYVPDVARAMPEQPDEQTLVFKIRPDVKFHNGRPLTVEDVKYSIDRGWKDAKSTSRSQWEYWLESTSTPDKETFVVKSKFPFAEQLLFFDGNKLGFMIAKEYEEGPDAATGIIGVGPFKYVSTQAPVTSTFKKNPDYHIKPYPYFDDLIVLTTTAPERYIADFLSRQVQMPFRASTDDAAKIRQGRPDAKELTYEASSTAVLYRADKPPFNDKRVRQALHMTVDRRKIRDGLTSGIGRDDQFFSLAFQKLFASRDPKDLRAAQAKLWSFDPTTAKQLMAAAGFDKPLEATLLHFDAGPLGQWVPDTATLMETTWRELGLANVKDDQRTQAVTSQLKQTGTFDSMTLSPNNNFPQGPDFIVAIEDQLFWDAAGRSGGNSAFMKNDQINVLADKQLKQLKIEDRKATYREMEPLVAEEANINCQSTTTKSWFWDPSLANANMVVINGAWQFTAKWWYA